MSIFTSTMKTHSRKEITNDFFGRLNLCKVHNHTPKMYEMVVGRRKEIWFTINCDSDDCGKIAATPKELIEAWNKWNPKPPTNFHIEDNLNLIANENVFNAENYENKKLMNANLSQPSGGANQD